MTGNWPFDPETGELRDGADDQNAAPGAPNIAEYSVSELSGALKRTLEDTFGYVRVRGELGRVSRPASGHIYLDLKDDRAVISAIIWKGVAGRMKVKPEQGLEVIVSGKITTYPGQSRYQIIIDTMQPAGAGALMALLEERKKKLKAEGLFDEDRKQPIPFLPGLIGVVTSPSGAVIRDILHRLSERFARHVVVWPVRVQGQSCASEVASAVAGFNAMTGAARPDLIIVARGGGSLEDLWGFNEEIAVRAVAASTIPVISAVGHETDWTLIDYAADLRSPTPSAAAERAVPVRTELLAQCNDLDARLTRAVARTIEVRRAGLVSARRGLPRPDDILSLARQRMDHASARLPRALRAGTSTWRMRLERTSLRLDGRALSQAVARSGQDIARLGQRARTAIQAVLAVKRQQISAAAKLLSTLSYHAVLERGFVLVRDDEGTGLHTVAATRPGQPVTLQFYDGTAGARIAGDGAPAKPQPAKRRRPRPGGTSGQGSLF